MLKWVKAYLRILWRLRSTLLISFIIWAICVKAVCWVFGFHFSFALAAGTWIAKFAFNIIRGYLSKGGWR